MLATRRASGVLAALGAAAITTTLAACGGSSGSTTASSAGQGSGKTFKLAAALIGPKNDKAFNQENYNGIVSASKQLGNVKLTAILDNLGTDQARSDAINTLAPINNVVVGVSAAFAPVFDVLAPKFASTYLIDNGGATKAFHQNVTSLVEDWGLSAFVAGVVSAHLTKTGIVGTVGGEEIPPTVQSVDGFSAGVHSVDPKIKVLKNILPSSFDVAAAKQATAAMIDDGADQIFPFLDAGIAGAYAAGRQSGKDPAMYKIILPDCTSYDNIIGTTVVNVTKIVSKAIVDRVHGQLDPGAIFIGLQDPELSTLQLCPRYRKQSKLQKLVQKTINGINGGDIKVPQAIVNPRPTYPYKEGFGGKTVNAAAG